MAKIRQLFNAASVETAKRRRVCHHNRRKHEVLAGEKCLVLRDAGTGGSKNYCVECGTAILDRAGEDLDALRKDLSA